ncbi:hypothetical protein WJX79_001368 [Trebouxia sp. C0005]
MATVQEERVDFVEFVIKNPARSTTPPFILRARASSTVSDLKKQLQAEYNGKPDPQTQTIIYAGKVLREESLLVKDFLRPRVDESALHPLHLVIKTDARPAQQSTPHAHPASSAGPSGYAPPPFQPRAAQQAPQGPQPQNAAMLAAYQAALNTFVNNRNPQQGMYAMHAAPMLAYMPVLIPSPYAAMQQGWPQQQQQQHQQQAGTSGQGQAPMQGQAPVQYPYPPFMPMMVPYGMPPPMQGMPGPFRVHVAGPHHQGAPTTGPNAGLRQRHMARGPAGGGPGVAEGLPAGMFRLRRVPGMQVRMVRIDLKALVQMAVVALVLYQHCPPGRFLMLMGGGALLYLTGLGPLQRALQRVVAMALPPPMRAPQAGQAGAAGQPAASPQWSFLGELQAVIVGFFSSLIPGWNMNAEDAAAFAAAQQMQAAEAAREAQRAGGGQPNAHQD